MMPVNFRDAAERHWKDAGYLLADARLANADHLFGFSAECSLKAMMCALGMGLREDGAPADRQYRVHINDLWDEFPSFANARSDAYYANQLSSGPNPFANWDVNQRYNHGSGIKLDVVEAHRQGAQIAKQILDDAILNGDVK